jgi:hypothetical protein
MKSISLAFIVCYPTFRLGHRYAIRETSLLKVIWGSDDRFDSYDDERLYYSIQGLCSFLDFIYNSAMDVLQMGIVFGSVEGYPYFDGDLDFHYDINCSTNGYSFLKDPINYTLTSADTRGYILAGIMSNTFRRQEFFGVEEERAMVNRARIYKWLQLVEQFVTLLAIAVHISGG